MADDWSNIWTVICDVFAVAWSLATLKLSWAGALLIVFLAPLILVLAVLLWAAGKFFEGFKH